MDEPQNEAAESPFPPLRDVVDAHYRDALRRAGGRMAVAAAMLGVSLKTVYNWRDRAKWEPDPPVLGEL
jgi:transposase